MKRTNVSCFALLGCALLSGCLNNRYIAPVTAFQTSTNQTISVISAFYTSRNSYEIQLYLSTVAADPTLTVGPVDAAGHPTPLGQPVFSPTSIKARLDALSLVGVYASRLYALANTSAPADFATASTALGTGLTSLNTTFQKLGASDGTAASYVGPIS
jgi:lysozyme family protein